MNGAGHQLFACTGFSQNQHRCIGGADRFHLFQDTPESGAFSNDLLKVVFSADLILKIEFFFRQPFFQLRHLPEG